MIEGDTHGGGVFGFLGLHRIGIVESASAVAAIDLIHRPLQAIAAELSGISKK
jgi:hypothetical protein